MNTEQTDSPERPLFNRVRIKRHEDNALVAFSKNPLKLTGVSRAKIRIVHEFLKQAHLEKHVILSDEGSPRGFGIAPSPIGYFVAAIGL